MSARSWAEIGATAFCALLWGAGPALRRCGLVRANYRGEHIPVGMGVVIVLWAAGAITAAAVGGSIERRCATTWCVALMGYGLLGLVDDAWGDRSASGIRGHLAALLRQGRLTTGLVKAVGGLALGFWLAHRVEPDALQTVVGGLVIALAANAANLLDLRPGRAGACFLVAAAAVGWPLAIASYPADASALALVAIPAFFVYLLDRRGTVMLGDTGSNPLGAAIGLSLVAIGSAYVTAVALVALVALHVVAERWSLSAIIAANAWLAWLDRLTGER